MSVQLDTIPLELRRLPRWVCWRLEMRGNCRTKVPYTPGSGRLADTTDSRTWRSFAEAVRDLPKRDGVGFVLGGGICGVDLDKCITGGETEDWAREIVAELNSYTELSPSRRGLHIILRGTVPPGGNRRGRIEMYSEARYFTMTGAHLTRTPATVEPRQAEIEHLHARLFPPEPEPQQPREPANLSLADAELLSKILGSKQGDKFRRLYVEGDWKGCGYPSQSEADMALAGILGWWTGGDVARIDALFRNSGLMRRKWTRDNYRLPTLERAAGG